MKKHGFTLIELMVVIVIMGVLSAVAVPKMFGMIAKSKASEIGPSAGIYVKLQDVFATETGAVGNWSKIGYVGPGYMESTIKSVTSYFDYDDLFATASGINAGTIEIGNVTAATNAWSAKSKMALNECPNQSEWTVSVKSGHAAEGSIVEYAATNPDNSGCEELTPKFPRISKQ